MSSPACKGRKQVQLRGISKEQVCVATALDRNKNITLKYAMKARK